VLAVSPSDEMALTLTQLWGGSAPGTLARSPVSGGTPRELTNDIAAADWTSDGKQLAVVRVKPGYQQLEFPIGHVLYQTTGGIGNPRISPKADLIAFLDEPIGLGLVGSVATVDMKAHRKTLTQLWLGQLTGLVWSSSSDEILFTAADFGLTDSLYAVSRSGRPAPADTCGLLGHAFVVAGPESERDRSLLARSVLAQRYFPRRQSSLVF
jgi:eukaryotic-like serine/threonine-protein kinase